MKQTAVEFLIKNLEIFNLIKEGDLENELFRQIELDSKKMEKQQIYGEEEVESLIKTTYEETMRGMVEWFANNKDKDPMDAESAIDNYIYPRLAEKGIVFKK